jgi:hypothetical protein
MKKLYMVIALLLTTNAQAGQGDCIRLINIMTVAMVAEQTRHESKEIGELAHDAYVQAQCGKYIDRKEYYAYVEMATIKAMNEQSVKTGN